MKEQARILVVDDNADLLRTLALILKRSGYTVDVAEDGASAVEKFKTNNFDLALMDIVMPRMDGVEAFRKIRESKPGARVILMTAYSDEELIRSALDQGAYSAIYKPIDIAKMMNLINEVVLKPLVLIVDDDVDLCNSMARMFELKGYRASTAHSGEEAIRIVRQTQCAIAFIDVKMPYMDGLETYLKLRKINPNITTIMMTGYRDEVSETVKKALAADAATCFYKPFCPTEVIDFMNRISVKVC
jgi:two-component system, NtrC family, response regulator HydG